MVCASLLPVFGVEFRWAGIPGAAVTPGGSQAIELRAYRRTKLADARCKSTFNGLLCS